MCRRRTGCVVATAVLVAILGFAAPSATYASGSAIISGTFVGGEWGALAVFDSETGALVEYACCMTSASWALSVPPTSCSSGGYKILWIPPDEFHPPRWYNSKDFFFQADCVPAPASGIDMTIPTGGAVTGWVKDSTTGDDINGATVFAFDATSGELRATAISGALGVSGQYRLLLESGSNYRLRAVATPYFSQWFDAADSFAEASDITPPATANFSLEPAGLISGYVKDSAAWDVDGAMVYAFDAADGTFAGFGRSGARASGRYEIGLRPGSAYKLLVQTGGRYPDMWFDGATSYEGASATVAPATANFTLPPPAGAISGFVLDRDSGAGIPQAAVYAFEYPSGILAAFTVARPDGFYSMTLPGGEYKLFTTADPSHEDLWSGDAWSWLEASIATPTVELTPNMSFWPRRAEFLTGVVYDEGSPSPYAYISAFPSDNPHTIPKNAVADGLGNFSIKLPEPVEPQIEPRFRLRVITQSGKREWYSLPVAPAAVPHSLLRNALTVEKTYFVDSQEYTDDLTALALIERGIDWTLSDPSPGSQQVKVGLTNGGMSVCLTARDSTGKYWALADNAVSPDAGTWYLRPSDSTDPLAGCTPESITSGVQVGWAPPPPYAPEPSSFWVAIPVAAYPQPIEIDIDPPAAQSNVLKAAAAEWEYYFDNSAFTTDTAALSLLEPSIDWTLADPIPGTDQVRVAVAQDAPDDAYCVTARDSSGRYWAVGKVATVYDYRFFHSASDPLPICTLDAIRAGSWEGFPRT
jgi:hypothetical protein